MKINKLKQFVVSVFLSLVMMATVLAPFAHAYRSRNDPAAAFGMLFVIILVWIIILLICREIYCWYTKVNLRIKIYNEHTELLKGILVACGGKLPKTQQQIDAEKP